MVGDGVVFVGVALGAAGGESEPSGAGGGNAIRHGVVAELEGIDTALFVEHGVAVETGGDDLLGGGVGQHVACELFDGELVEPFVGIEGCYDVVAVGPDRAITIFFVAIGVGVSGEVKPSAGPAFAVAGRGEEFVDDFGVGFGCGIGGKGVGDFDGGRKAGEVEMESADESVRIGLGGEFVGKEVIDGVGVEDGRFFRENEGPMGFVSGSLFDPLFEKRDLIGQERFVGLRWRHDFVGIGGDDAGDDLLPVLFVCDVETEPGFTEGFAFVILGVVGAVAFEAVAREDGADVAGEREVFASDQRGERKEKER